VLPSSYPNISFDSSGTCSFCADYDTKPRISQQTAKLKELINRAKKITAPYQVVVPVSGGKDSAFVLYTMVRKYNLRALAINFNNGFRSQAAETNLHAIVNTLSIDYVSLKPNWTLMKDLYAAFLKGPGEFCSVCNAVGYLVIMSYLMTEQAKYNIDFPVIGGWSQELEAMPGLYSFDIKYFRDIINNAGLGNRLLQSSLINERCLISLTQLRDPRQLNDEEELYTNYLMLPRHMPWKIYEISETLKKELNWSVPLEAENETHFDCVMYPVAKYIERRKFGFSQSTVTYSSLVRSEQMPREQALLLLKQEDQGKPKEYADFLLQLGITETDINWQGKWHAERG
jgi:hypothetical protein